MMPRSLKRRALAFIPLLLLASLALACTGGDTYQVQEPVNDSRTAYEEWLQQIGALPDFGPPYISSPNSGDTVSGSIEIKGWAVKGEPGSIVHVYAAPSADAKDDSLLPAFEVGSASVETSTGLWKLTIDGSRFKTGRMATIAARTEVPGRGMTDYHRVAVEVEDAAPPAQRPAKETLDLVCVMADLKDDDLKDGSEAKARELIDEVDSYWRHVSHGNLAVGSVTWVHAEEPLQLPQKDANWTLLKSVIVDPEVASALKASFGAQGHSVGLVVFLPPVGGSTAGYSAGWSSVRSEFASTTAVIPDGRRGSAIAMFEYNPAVLAHELAHGIGSYRKGQGTETYATTQLPDLYKVSDDSVQTFWENEDSIEYYGFGDYSNLGGLSSASGYYLMAQMWGRDKFVATPCGYSQEWLDWVEWDEHDVAEDVDIDVPNLSRAPSALTEMPVFTWEEDGRKCLVVPEGRTFLFEYHVGGNREREKMLEWDEDGVVLYKMRMQSDDEKKQGKSTRGADFPRSVDYLETLSAANPVYVDLGDGYRAELAGGTFDGGADSAGVKWAPIEWDRFETPPWGMGTNGVLMETPFDAPPRASRENGSVQGAVSAEASPAPIPDLDLHAYLADGRHVGVDPQTGAFENPVEGALVSGDRSLDSEWIVLPPELAAEATFVVSSEDTKRYLDAGSDVSPKDVELAYSVRAVSYNEAAGSASRSDAREAVIAAGMNAQTTISVGDEGLSIAAMGDPRDELVPATVARDRVARSLLMFGGAVLLLAGGIVVLLWPGRRSRS